MEEYKCLSFIKTLDFDKLSEFKETMLENREAVVDSWASSPRLTSILNDIGLTVGEFKSIFAYHIFDYFYEYTEGSTPYMTCPIAREFLNNFRKNEHSIRMITLICTEFKNKLTKVIFSSILETDIKMNIFDLFSTILDINLASILSEYSEYILTTAENNIAKLQTLEESALVTKTDLQGNIIFVSDSFCKITDYSRLELVGGTYKKLRHPEVPSRVYEQMWKKLKQGKEWKGRLKNYNKHGEEIVYYTKIMPDFDFDHNIIGYTAIKTDLTDKINARTDALTGIMNRLKFNEKINLMVRKYYENTTNINLIIMDIDYFKKVNDNFGHVVGDEVLKYFTSVVLKNIRPTDTFARWGGEEFVLLLPEVSFEVALEMTERVRKAIDDANFPAVGNKTASFGLVSYSDECESILAFIEKADECLYHSKDNGRNIISYSKNCNTPPQIYHP